MKNRNTFFLIFALFAVQISYGQRAYTTDGAKLSINKHEGLNVNARATDIVLYPTADDECSSTVTIYGFNEAWGAVSGTNEFADKEKAQLLEYTGSAVFKVIGAGAFFDTTRVVGDGVLRAKVYSASSAGSPQDLLATSTDVKASELIPPSDTSIELTAFAFEAEQAEIMDTRFFISLDISSLYETQDTAAIYHTLEDCGDGANTWELWSDDTWHTITEIGLNADWLLIAVIEFDDNTTSDQYVEHEGLQLFPCTPNPASDYTMLHFAVDQISPVTIEVFDAAGKMVKKIARGDLNQGRHEQRIFTHDLDNGIYSYRIATAKGQLMSRFMVQR